jgi:hypothetical protein
VRRDDGEKRAGEGEGGMGEKAAVSLSSASGPVVPVAEWPAGEAQQGFDWDGVCKKSSTTPLVRREIPDRPVNASATGPSRAPNRLEETCLS